MIEDKLRVWHEAENAALAAEAAVSDVGQGASDPRFRDLLQAAAERRAHADALFAELQSIAGEHAANLPKRRGSTD